MLLEDGSSFVDCRMLSMSLIGYALCMSMVKYGTRTCWLAFESEHSRLISDENEANLAKVCKI